MRASSCSHTSVQVANHCISRTAQAAKESLGHNVEEAVTCAEDFDQLIKHDVVQFLACPSSAPKAPETRPKLHASGKRRPHTTVLVGINLLKDQHGQALQAYAGTSSIHRHWVTHCDTR